MTPCLRMLFCCLASALLALAAACQRETAPPSQTRPAAPAVSPKPATPAAPKPAPPVAFKDVSWPELPERFAPEGAKVTIRAPLKDGLLGVEELELETKELAQKRIRVVGDEMRLQWVVGKGGEKAGFMVWNHLKAQPEGGTAMEMFGAVEGDKLVGYRYDLAAVRSLGSGDRLAILDPTGWRTVVVKAPVEGDVLGVEGFEASVKGKAGTRTAKVGGLRLVNALGDRIALVWAE